jgi:hypothetical protein
MDALPVVIPSIGLIILQGILIGCAYCNLTRRLTKLEIATYVATPPLSASIVTRTPPFPPFAAPAAARPGEFVSISLHDGQAAENSYVGGYRF